jgi:pteridine reductase
MEIKGTVALVTGAAKRIGKSIAMALAKKGATVVLHYHNSEEEAYSTAQLIEQEGGKAICLRADLSSVQEISSLVSESISKAGAIDILVNAASQFQETRFGEITEKDWDLHFDTNVKGAFFLSQYSARSMLQRQKGKIVNIIDSHISHPYLHYLPYLVSKSGLAGLTYCLARELAPHIQVNAISPGPVLMQPSWGPMIVQEIIDSIPLNRIGSPEDIVKGVIFCIEGSDFMTGAIIHIDGGQRLK